MKTFSKIVFLTLAASASAYYDSVEVEANSSKGSQGKILNGAIELGADQKVRVVSKAKKSKDGSDKEYTSKTEKSESSDKSYSSKTEKSSSDRSSKTEKSTTTSRSSSSKSEKTSSKDSRSCKDVDDDKPKSVRNGDNYVFELYKKNAKCVDKDDKLYEYGQFNNVKEFSDCADACVKDVRSSTLDSLQGYDWDCDNRKCRCLYDKGTLDNRNSGEYDKTNKENRGKGSVKDTTKKDDYFCAKLEKVKLADVKVTEVRQALRG